MRVRLSAAARDDLIHIGDVIAHDSPLRARDFIRRLRGRVLQIGDMPRAFPLVPGFEARGIRRRVYGDYLIF